MKNWDYNFKYIDYLDSLIVIYRCLHHIIPSFYSYQREYLTLWHAVTAKQNYAIREAHQYAKMRFINNFAFVIITSQLHGFAISERVLSITLLNPTKMFSSQIGQWDPKSTKPCFVSPADGQWSACPTSFFLLRLSFPENRNYSDEDILQDVEDDLSGGFRFTRIGNNWLVWSWSLCLGLLPHTSRNLHCGSYKISRRHSWWTPCTDTFKSMKSARGIVRWGRLLRWHLPH